MATDAKSIIYDNWFVAIIARGTIAYDSVHPKDGILQGISLEEEMDINPPSGMSFKHTNAEGNDLYRIHIYDYSPERVRLRLSVLIKIADTFTGNTQYERIRYRYNDIVWDKSSEGGRVKAHKRHIQVPFEFIKNNKALYT
jgi:hypothetical protein